MAASALSSAPSATGAGSSSWSTGLRINRNAARRANACSTGRFVEWVNVKLFTAGDTVEDAPVWMGSSATVPLVGGRELTATLPRDWKQRTKIAIEYTSPLPAPVVRGTQVGRLVVSGQGVPDMSVPLLVGADVPRLGVPGRAMAVLSHWISG